MIVPRGDERILPGDRIVVIASPRSARAWSFIIAHGEQRIDDIVVFGAGRMGTTIARCPARARDPRAARRRRRQRAHAAAKASPAARVFHAGAFDREFLEHERIGRSTATVFATNDDPRNLFGAIVARPTASG